MADETRQSRREVLAGAAKTAGLAGMATMGGCSEIRGPALMIAAGPTPKPIGPRDTIRFGLIGVGGQCRHLLQFLVKHENISFKALADPDEANRQRAVKMIKDATGQAVETYSGHEDYKVRLLPRDDIDAVVSATPCHLHAEIYSACFAAGKHFYGEKPMCLEARHADSLVEAQSKNPSVVAQIGFQRRATELYAAGIQRVRDGAIADPIDGRAAWNNDWGPIGLPKEGARVWYGRRKLSGDWMLEQACHTWDVLNWVAGEMPVAASGVGRRDIFEDLDPLRDVTDYYIAHLQYPGGFTVDFEHSWFCPRKDGNRFNGVFEYVAGRKGGIALNEGKLFWRDPEAEPLDLGIQQPDHYEASVAAFLNSIRTGAPVVSGVMNGRMATCTGLLVRKAVDERRWVEMGEIV